MKIEEAKILCVEDEPVSLRLLQKVLSPMGSRILTAESGPKALEILAEENIDIVLLDIVMPGMDGYEVCRAIKGAERTRNIPVIFITGLTSKEDRIRGIEAGAEEFLTKPFDAAEVIARVKMLLKVKKHNEMRTGRILIELGLIDELQLREALRISKEKHIKVGEALYEMGALSRDTIYWGLSTQLRMTYVELTPDMADQELIRRFPLDTLRRLQCLPLYETGAEIHFAIADPTDHQVVEAVKGLMPGKDVQLHLGLPEKIADVLSFCEQEFSRPPIPCPEPGPSVRPESPAPAETAEPGGIPDSSRAWDDLTARLLSMPVEGVYWLHKKRQKCRLLAGQGAAFEVLREYPAEVYALFQDRVGTGRSSRYRRGGGMAVLPGGSSDRPAALRVSLAEAADGGFIRIQRLPIFSKEAFEGSYPEASRLTAEIKGLFEEHHHLAVGGPDRLLIKQVCYGALLGCSRPAAILPVFFLENEADIYLPEAAQLSAREWDPGYLLRSLGEDAAPLVFYEAGSRTAESPAAGLAGLSSGMPEKFILGLSCASAREMDETLSLARDWLPKGFGAVYLEASRLTPIG